MIHLSFRELATKTDTPEKLEKIAAALKAAESTEKIMIYYEFDTPEHLRLFALALQMMPKIGEIENLEERKEQLEGEIADLEKHAVKLSEIRRYSGGRR